VNHPFLHAVRHLACGTCAAVSLYPAHAADDAPDRPNFLVIMADDLGYGDVASQGAEFPTPHLDSIAAQGTRFTDAYVTSAVCAPSRAGFLTGRYQDRFGFRGSNPEPNSQWGLPASEVTLATLLRDAGYRTALFGKWHLGKTDGIRPADHGFERFYGFLSGKHSYWNADDPEWGPIVREDNQPAALNQYLTFALADEAIGFIKESKKDPFFVFLSFSAPHGPMEAPDDYLAKAAHIKPRVRALCAAMIMAMDDATGRVLAALRSAGVADRTVILFLSDNGAAILPGSDPNGGSNAPLRGSKAELWEGGIRVPLFAAWPGRWPAGQVIADPISTLDVFPTFASLAGIALPPSLDGRSLLPILGGTTDSLPPRDLFWRFYPTQSAVRSGDLKWTRVAPDAGLFDLRSDLTESRDLSSERPEDLERLQKLWRSWHSHNSPGSLSGRND